MQRRKELRRLKKLNIYSREFTGNPTNTQDSKMNMVGSPPKDIKHSESTQRPAVIFTQEHSPSNPNSKNRSATNSSKTPIGTTTTSETITARSPANTKSRRTQCLNQRSPHSPPTSDNKSTKYKTNHQSPTSSIPSSSTTDSTTSTCPPMKDKDTICSSKQTTPQKIKIKKKIKKNDCRKIYQL